ncbi:MAG: ATP-dependent helicase RecQ [Candidatus Binatota bacterium]|jgi:ATP-dependent DNA helicase RecQ|nr:ATP-dependent helicase RecQ [Candidatus Binatota bacterium]
MSRRRRRRRHHGGGGGNSQAPAAADRPLGEVENAARRLGIAQLYPEQQRVIGAALGGRDVLVVLPTGFGKSACYQIPSMILPKPVVLISPLLALLRDQHEKLLKRNIPCVRIDGTVRGKARKEALERVRAGGPLLVMTTPETLGSAEASEAIRQCGVSLAAVDEAHCISAWGHDFRPAYLQLGERLKDLGAPPLMGLTATVTEHVREDILRYLGLRDPEVVSSSPHRANLAFEVLESKGDARLRALVRFARRLRRPGIIYCSTTKEVDNVFMALKMLRIPAHRYHGKMSAGERNQEQEMYMKSGRRTVMVATSAFGLGIDKPDIRYIVHYQSPASLEQYVQEAGRAGRDGRKANCILLYDPADRTIHEALLQTSRVRPDQLYKVGKALAAWAGEGRTPTLEALALSAGLGPRIASALLAVLEEAELVEIGDDGIRVTIPADEVEQQSRTLAGQFETLRTQDSRRLDTLAEYTHEDECRAVFLRRYFGEQDGVACGLCDVCTNRPERPSSFWEPIAPPEHRKKKRRRRRRGGNASPPAPKPAPARQPPPVPAEAIVEMPAEAIVEAASEAIVEAPAAPVDPTS